MGIVIVDGKPVEIRDDERLNGIQVAARAGVEIPHYCWHPGLSVVGSCRMCLVEMGTRDPRTGQISMLPKLTPACNTRVRDGMVLVTNSERVQQARAMVEEDLLLRHPVDCPICDKAGECLLQDYHYKYGQKERRADVLPFTSRRRDVGDGITLFVDRCIMCTRCVRFCREISGTGELMVAGRGAHEEIDVFPGFPLANKLSGNVVDLCPVGALGDKDFLYKQRVWFLRRHASICPGCATGCSVWVEENQDRIWRIKPRENPHVNRWWICNDGRYLYPHVHDPRRLRGACRRAESGYERLQWSEAIDQIDRQLRQSKRLAAVFSPFLTVEEAYLLAGYVRSIDARAPLVLGPIPGVGRDERFPGGFTIAAEKCPNRRGVEEVIAHFTGRVTPFEELVPVLRRAGADAVWISGGYREPVFGEALTDRLQSLGLLVVLHDLFPSPLSQRATYVLASAAVWERDGSFVNRADRLQQMRRAARPPADVWPEGSVLWRLTGRRGLYDAPAVLQEIASQVLYFHAAGKPVPEVGVDLKVNILAGEAAGAGEQPA